MNKPTLLFALILGLFNFAAQAQGFIQLGTIFTEDQGHRLILTSDNGFITAGSAGPGAVLYKTNCAGQLVSKIEKTLSPDPALFRDVTELPDGSLVAVGEARISTPNGPQDHVILLKTTSNLFEITLSSFQILGKAAVGKSIISTPDGQLLVWGEVAGTGVDFTDAFFQRVDPGTLMPATDPVIFNNGVDRASRIIRTNDGNYLLSGVSFFGNIFDPGANINNFLRLYKVDEHGNQIWATTVLESYAAQYGVATVCGVAQSAASNNFMLGGTLYGGTDERKQDAFFALISNSGEILDTSYAAVPGLQKMHAIVAHNDFPGLFSMVGETEGSPFNVPALALAQVFEQADAIFVSNAIVDLNNPISIRDAVEVDPGRFAFIATLPDNPFVLTSTDIIVSTPETSVEVVYQNCALAVSSGTPGVVFQWQYEGQNIPNANQGVYFPSEPGLYTVQILDDRGCYGLSDTFRVKAPVANFSFDANNLTVVFTNLSEDATLYSWDFGDGSFSIQPNPTHIYAANGVYAVTLIAQTACGFKDTIVQQIGVVSVNEPSWLTHLNLSPNPTDGVFRVEVGGHPQSKLDFALFNAIGQQISNETASFQSGWMQKSFDLEQWPAGVYYLQIKSGQEAKNLRVVKR